MSEEPNPGLSFTNPFRLLFAVLLLSSTYEKSGVTVELAGRNVSVAVYKLLFVAAVVLYLFEPRRRAGGGRTWAGRRLYRLLIGCVIVQTVASFLGNVTAPGQMGPLSSEVYYLIQRSTVVVIPLLAVRYNIPPKTVLKLFLAAVLVHGAFIVFQFAAPDMYMSFVEAVTDAPSYGESMQDYVASSIRPDNSFEWDKQSWSFIGLQRTGNYGTFAMAFGLLALGLRPRQFVGRSLRAVIVLGVLFVVLFSPSRATLIMTAVVLLMYFVRSRYRSRLLTLVAMGGVGLVVTGLLTAEVLPVENVTSIYAFYSPEKEGSNLGKLAILQWGVELFFQSPLVGWGSRSFANISAGLGNTSFSTSENHFYFLSVLLSSGLIGLAADIAKFVGIVRAVLSRKDRDYCTVAAMFIGLGTYNMLYDAGALDLFACFNGVAAYYALSAMGPRVRQASVTPFETAQIRLPS